MEVKHTITHNISWKNTFNTRLCNSFISQPDAFNEARKAGYPYITWNGWVYETKGEGREIDQLVLAQQLGE